MSGSGQISSRICRMPVQMQYVQLIADKTMTQMTCQVVYLQFNWWYPDENTKLIGVPWISSKTGKQWHDKGNTELYCLFIAADSIVDTISFIRRIVLWLIRKHLLPKSGEVCLETLRTLVLSGAGPDRSVGYGIAVSTEHFLLGDLCSRSRCRSQITSWVPHAARMPPVWNGWNK